MKHAGRAMGAALKLIFLSLLGAVVLGFIARVINIFPNVIMGIIGGIWLLFTLFTLYFFRDPIAKTPDAPGLVVSPGHGKIDFIDKIEKSDFLGEPCHRISMFLSVIDVHVQNAPISGKVICVTHTAGKFLNALEADSAVFNENVLIGFESTDTPGEKIGLRLIAGVLARRIIPFVQPGDVMLRGERISLIQFGSRCDMYIPLNYTIKVKLGDRVVGGESVLASK